MFRSAAKRLPNAGSATPASFTHSKKNLRRLVESIGRRLLPVSKVFYGSFHHVGIVLEATKAIIAQIAQETTQSMRRMAMVDIQYPWPAVENLIQ
jgi:hypothetical protein